MSLRTFFINCTLIIFGVLGCLFFAEVGLTLAGKILLSLERVQYDKISKKYFSSDKGKKSFKILCIGDSSTYGYGSSVAIPYSYPFQLSKLLNRGSPSFEVTVISSGGINTSQLASRYENFLKTAEYDMVIFQAGVNDVHSLAECNIPIYTDYDGLRRLADSRLFKLIKMFLCPWKTRPGEIDHRHPKLFGIGKHFFLKRASLKKLFRYNLGKIANISKRYKVMLWVQDYHSSGWAHPDAALSKVYDELGLSVIHQKEIFDYAQGIRIRGKDRWHPNCYGYFIIARLIYNNMIERGIVRGEKYDLHSEIDMIRDYIKNQKEGYQCLVDDKSKLDEKNLIRVLKKTGIRLDKSDSDVGRFRISSVFSFDKKL